MLELQVTNNPGEIVYPWTRYWCSPEGKLNLWDSGYLSEPLGTQKYLNKGVVAYEEIDSFHMLGCLGEPGIGKSVEIIKAIELKTEFSTATNDAVMSFDLDGYSAKSLEENIFRTKKFDDWLSGSHKLYLFFDNLDRVDLPQRLAKDLHLFLKDSSLERLYIRIGCRTFHWPLSLENSMRNLFGRFNKDQSVGVFELAPLTRTNVRVAAQSNNINVAKFMSDIHSANIVPLASRPLTLNFLLNKYKQEGKLAYSSSQLYKDGCELLCYETNLELQDCVNR